MESDRQGKVLINRSTLGAIGDAIRTKNNSTDTYKPSEMPAAIQSITSGGGVSEVESIAITNKADFTNIKMPTNGTYKDYPLNVTITPSTAPKAIRVILSNPSMAAVIDNGDGTYSLRIRDTGQTTVTVTDYSGIVSDSFELSMTAELQDIWFPYNAISMDEGGSRQLSPIYKPHFATDKQLEWSSDNPNIAVNQSGLLTATSTGHAIIKASSPFLNKQIQVTVDAGTRDINAPDWAAIRAAVQAGNSTLTVGSTITDKWIDKSNNNKEYDLTWRVVDFYEQVEKEDGTAGRGMVLLAENALPWENVPFENEQRVVADEATAQEGVYYYGFNGSTYTPLNLQVGDVIAHELYTKIYKSGIDWSKNMSEYSNYGASGINWWKDSSIRQFLNSESDQAGFRFTPQHISDYNHTNNVSRRGFLSGVTPSFLSALTPIKVQTMRNTKIWNGEVDITYDRIFLPSYTQMGFIDNTAKAIEGDIFQYFAQMATENERNNARKRMRLGSTSSPYWWLRSAYRTNSYNEYYINYSGSYGYTAAYNSSGVVPACIIC